MKLFIIVDDSDTIIDIASERVNLSPSRIALGQTHEVETNERLFVGDHYKNGKLTLDSLKREELKQKIQKKKDDAQSAKNKLKNLGLNDDEIKAMFGE
jgi:hypothetical protein